MKTRFLWWPLHPGGYVLISGTGMGRLWFTIFLSWLAKATILKIGGVKLYRQAVPFFLGLILGDYYSRLYMEPNRFGLKKYRLILFGISTFSIYSKIILSLIL